MEASPLRLRWVILASVLALIPLLPLLAGLFPATGDMRDVFIPLESFFREQQLQASIPSWNPAVSFGFPVLASAQIGFFYPPLLLLRFLPIYLELPLALILHTLFAAIGTFLFARKLKLSYEAATLTTLAFVLSQFVWQHITHLNIFLAVSWLPWQMLAVHTLFQKKKVSSRDIAVLSSLFGIPLLIGQLQMQLLMMGVALLYGLYVRRKDSAQTTSSAFLPSIYAVVLALLLAAVQLVPTLELVQLSSRGSSEGFDITRANQHSYPLYHLPTLLFPRFYGNDNTYWGKRLEIEYGSYIGVIPLLLAGGYIWNRKRVEQFWVWLLGISFLLSLGSLSPFRLIGIEPSLWFFSAPARWLLCTTLAASILAGYGLDALQQSRYTKRLLFILTLSLFAILGIANLSLVFGDTILSQMSLSDTVQEKLHSMLTSARHSSISFLSPYTYIPLISLAVLPFILNRKKYILTLIAIDLAIIATTTSPLTSWSTILTPPDTITRLPESVLSHNARIYSLRDGGDTGAYFTDPTSRADDAKRAEQRQLLLPMIGSQFGVYGVEWPASLDIISQTTAREALPSNAADLGIGAILSAQEGKVDIQRVDAKPRVEVLGGTASIISESPTSLTIQTNTSKDSTLIVRDTYYPGWHAYVDGKKVALSEAKPFFRAVDVPIGEHTVTMIFVSKSMYVGEGISLVTLLVCIICVTKKPSGSVSALRH